jgi:hypothetical protein
MLRAARAPWVRYNNIVGVVPQEGFWNRFSQGSDGVVDLASAHMEDVESEIVVESKHQDIHRKPRAILEVRQILVEHLEMLRSENRLALAPVDPKSSLLRNATELASRNRISPTGVPARHSNSIEPASALVPTEDSDAADDLFAP